MSLAIGLFRKFMAWLGTSLLPGWHFERLYARRPDPWACETSKYERLKTERTRDTICRFCSSARVLDVGCGEGILVDMLADLGHKVWGYEISGSAVKRACDRCTRHHDVHLFHMDIRQGEMALGKFDVIVVSEVLYYLGLGEKRRRNYQKLVESTMSSGYIVAVNPWPRARSIERALEMHPELELADRQVFPDQGRPYAITAYRRRKATTHVPL